MQNHPTYIVLNWRYENEKGNALFISQMPRPFPSFIYKGINSYVSNSTAQHILLFTPDE